jgi:lipid II:glycine glycyltransferase (peptidoglycan interpeptide bridge formation enzyme)
MADRDDYVKKLKSQLDHWNTETAKWETQTKAAQASMRAEYDKQIAAFRQKRDQAIEQLSKVQSASGEAWKDLARGADEAWAKMREAFDKAHSHFKKK